MSDHLGLLLSIKAKISYNRQKYFEDIKLETIGNFRVYFLEITGNFNLYFLEVNGNSLFKKYPRIGNYKSNIKSTLGYFLLYFNLYYIYALKILSQLDIKIK